MRIEKAVKYKKGGNLSDALIKDLKFNRYVYLMLLPVVAYYFIFSYIPMYGAQIAFKDFYPGLGIWKSPWVGLDNFKMFIGSIYFFRLIRNTVLININSIIFGFPVPIILALLINEIRNNMFKKTVQTVSYLPHFVSMVVVCGMLIDFLARDGVVNNILGIFGIKPVSFLIESAWFRTVYVVSGIWQESGWASVIYLAALSGIDPQLYEAAEIDGAKRWKKMLHITIPGIMPTIIILFILRIGHMMNVGAEKILLLYNTNTYETADVISTFVYRKGLLEMDYSYSAMIGLFNSVINFSLLLATNAFSKRVSETSLW